MKMASRIRQKLEAAFRPSHLELIDDSQRHAGHAGARPGGETHFNVVIVSETFNGMGRVARSRLVHAALADELADGVHALSIKAKAPGES
ncbi:MAG TPA: BolA family protein [Micropepsaceae bacterium]|nr:BolA family protein [Micropepsaceae bacterium]